MTALPPLLEALRSASVDELHAVSFEGIIPSLTLEGIAESIPHLEREWANHANAAHFRMLLLRLLARVTVYQSLIGGAVRAEFWDGVAKSPNPTDRRTAILACNLSDDEHLWQILVRASREDARGVNRALALETMGTTGRRDAAKRMRTIGEYRQAIAGSDAMAMIGALHGSLFFKEDAAEEIPRRVLGQTRNGEAAALAFAVLLARNPRRAPRLFAAIVGYISARQPDPRGAAMLLGVCALCDAAATRRLCQRAVRAQWHPRLRSLRAGARYLLAHGVAHPKDLRRRSAKGGLFPG